MVLSFRFLHRKKFLQHFIYSEVILGFRPEHLEEKTFADAPVYKACISETVEVIETLGVEVQLNVTAGGRSLVARVDARIDVERHETIELALNMDHIHFFEKDSPGNRIVIE